MADENQELQREMAELTQAMQGLDTATKSASVSLVGLAKNAATGLGSFAKQVGQGDTSFKALNKIVDVTTDALGGMAKAIPYAGEAVAAGLKATAEAAKFMLDQMDQTTQAFNELGKVGALTASGMSGLQQQFITSGLNLKTFTKQVADNSVALARFRGMTGDGAEAFSEIAGKLTQGGDDSLRRLGMSAEQIGESVAGFVTQQTRLGRAQTMTNAQLEKGAKDYAMQLDELSKLTGQSADSLRKQQDAALSESRFRASINSLNKEQQDELLKLQSIMAGFGAEMGQGTRDLVSGAANTEAARKLMVDTGGAAQDIINRLKAGQIDTAQATKELQTAVQRNLKASENYSQFQSDASGAMGNFASKADFATARFDQFGNRIKDVQKSQVEGTDDLTNKTVAAQKNMERMNIEIQKLGFTFLPKAADAVEAMTGAMNRFVRYVNEKIGGGPAAAPSGGGPPGVGTEFGGAGAGGTGAEAGPAALSPQERMSGLRIKSPEAYAGGQTSEQMIGVAEAIQKQLGGDLKHFSAFNDSYHQGTNSKHAAGRALDFTITDPSKAAQIAAMIQGVPGITKVIDEYNNPSSRATAGHIHAEISAARGFNGVLSGPSSGYQPNLTMHGTESISIQPATPGTTAANMMDSGLMKAQLERLDELVSVMKNQLSVSTKIMQYSS